MALLRRSALRPLALLLTAACVGSGGCADDSGLGGLRIVGDDVSGRPLRGIEASLLARFDEGDLLFSTAMRESDGLGPLFVRSSCGSCHAEDARGPGAVRKMAIVAEDGFTPVDASGRLEFGHTVRPQLAAGATHGIELPADTTGLLETTRLGLSVFARGYLEAIEEAEILRVESAQQHDPDGVSGRVNRVVWTSQANPEQGYHGYGPGSRELVGRFGAKARIATVDEFTADAFQGDMGITSPLRPTELPNPDGLADDARAGVDVDLHTVNAISDYVRLLDIPTRAEPNPRGVEVFTEIGCATCHVPSLRTRADYPIALLADVDAPLYTDVLLHDMGRGLADGIEEMSAGSREWRTAPLVGIRFLRAYLHDGRARTVDEAIRAHESEGSEANPSIARYRALAASDRAALEELVESL